MHARAFRYAPIWTEENPVALTQGRDYADRLAASPCLPYDTPGFSAVLRQVYEGPAGVGPLLEMVRAAEPGSRAWQAAMWGLGQVGDAVAAEAVLGFAGSADDMVAATAVESLALIGTPESEAAARAELARRSGLILGGIAYDLEEM